MEKRWRSRRSAIRPHLPGHQPNVEVNGSTARGQRGRRVTANSQTLNDLHVEEIRERRFVLSGAAWKQHTLQLTSNTAFTHTEHTPPQSTSRLFMRLYPLQVSLVWTCETCNRSTQNELPDASTPHEKSPERSSTCSLEPCQPLREPALRGLHVPVEKGRNTDPLFKEEEENQKKQTSPCASLCS